MHFFAMRAYSEFVSVGGEPAGWWFLLIQLLEGKLRQNQPA